MPARPSPSVAWQQFDRQLYEWLQTGEATADQQIMAAQRLRELRTELDHSPLMMQLTAFAAGCVTMAGIFILF